MSRLLTSYTFGFLLLQLISRFQLITIYCHSTTMAKFTTFHHNMTFRLEGYSETTITELEIFKPKPMNLNKWKKREIKDNQTFDIMINNCRILLKDKDKQWCSDLKCKSFFYSNRVLLHEHWRLTGEQRTEGTIFFLLYHFHTLMNIQTFVCSFACKITTTQSQRL